MTEIKINFQYKNNNKIIKSNSDEKMISICNKFIKEINLNLLIDELSFYYEDKEIEYESKFCQHFGDKTDIVLIVKESIEKILK